MCLSYSWICCSLITTNWIFTSLEFYLLGSCSKKTQSKAGLWVCRAIPCSLHSLCRTSRAGDGRSVEFRLSLLLSKYNETCKTFKESHFSLKKIIKKNPQHLKKCEDCELVPFGHRPAERTAQQTRSGSRSAKAGEKVTLGERGQRATRQWPSDDGPGEAHVHQRRAFL